MAEALLKNPAVHVDAIIRNGLDCCARFQPRALPPIGRIVRLVSVARMEKEKGMGETVRTVVELIRLHVPVVWTLVGDGTLRRNILRRLTWEGIGRKVRWIGWDPRPERWLAASNLYILLPREEAFGNALGGGFTGVELAGSLKSYHVSLLEQRVSLLSNMPAAYGRYARNFLESSGIDVRLSSNIIHVDASTVYTDSKEFPYDLLIWAGGIKPPHWIAESGIPCGPRGYPIADARGQVDEHLFVAGDLWQLSRFSAGAPLQTAETAQAMGSFVGRVIAAHVLGTRVPRLFHHSTRGMVVSLGLLRGVGWVLTPSVPLHGVLAGELKLATLFRYRRGIWHRADHKRRVS